MLGAMAADDWEHLLAHLATLGTPVRVADGQVDLALDDRVVSVLVTARDWDSTVGTVWGGDVGGALRDVSRAVRALGPDDRFLVFENYALHPSPTEETPMQREDRQARRRVEEIRRQVPDARMAVRRAPRRKPRRVPGTTPLSGFS